MSRALKKKSEAGAPALYNDMEKDSGQGLPDHVDDYAVPFLAILQSGSPQVKKGNPKYMKEAESSMIRNTITDDLYDGEEGIIVIPVLFERKYLEYVPRDSGGGLVAIYNREDGVKKEATCKRNDRNIPITEEGNELRLVCQHYVILLNDDGSTDKAVISMASTQIKKSKQWNTIMARQNIPGKKIAAPSYACKYKLTTIFEDNSSGDWFGWKIQEPTFLTDKDLVVYQEARSFYKSIKEGSVRMQDHTEDEVI